MLKKIAQILILGCLVLTFIPNGWAGDFQSVWDTDGDNKLTLSDVITGLQILSGARIGPVQYEVIYTSQNLCGHLIAAECNPGGTLSCDCSIQDVSIESFETHGQIVSNSQKTNTYVNAIGYKKFIDAFSDDIPIALGVYKYSGQFKITIIPKPDINQIENPQAVHMMIQLWDGNGALYTSNKNTLEGAIYWDINPWLPEEYGKIKVYSKNDQDQLALIDTGITLNPDMNWHTFEMVVDLENKKYVYVTIDNETKELNSVKLAEVSQPEWDDSLFISITTESMAASSENCSNVFTWTTLFKNLRFSALLK